MAKGYCCRRHLSIFAPRNFIGRDEQEFQGRNTDFGDWGMPPVTPFQGLNGNRTEQGMDIGSVHPGRCPWAVTFQPFGLDGVTAWATAD
jgi:hypothetical protein